MATPSPAAPIALSIAGLLSSSAFGVSIETIATGMGFAIVGMLGRFAFDLQKALEAGDKVRLTQALSWVSAGFVGAPFVTVIWIVMLRAVGAQTDTTTVIGLIVLGFSGAKGVMWLLGTAIGLLRQILPKGTPPFPEPPK